MTRHCENCTCEDILANKQKELEILKQEHSYLKNIIDGPVYRFSRKIVQAMLLDLSEHEDKIKKLQEEIAKIKKHQGCGGTVKPGGVLHFQTKSSIDGCKCKYKMPTFCPIHSVNVCTFDEFDYLKLKGDFDELKKEHETLKIEYEKLCYKHSSLETKYSVMSTYNSGLQGNYNALQRSNEELKKDFKDADGQRCALAEKLLYLEMTHAMLNESFDFLKRKYHSLKKEHETLKKKYDSSEVEHAHMSTALGIIQKENKEFERAYDSLQKERDWLKGRLYNYFTARTD